MSLHNDIHIHWSHCTLTLVFTEVTVQGYNYTVKSLYNDISIQWSHFTMIYLYSDVTAQWYNYTLNSLSMI